MELSVAASPWWSACSAPKSNRTSIRLLELQLQRLVFSSAISRSGFLFENYCTEPAPWISLSKISLSNVCGRNSKRQSGEPSPRALAAGSCRKVDRRPDSGAPLPYLQNTNRGLAKCVEQGAPLATRATWKQRVATVLVVNLGYLPAGRQAPERVYPAGNAAGRGATRHRA